MPFPAKPTFVALVALCLGAQSVLGDYMNIKYYADFEHKIANRTNCVDTQDICLSYSIELDQCSKNLIAERYFDSDLYLKVSQNATGAYFNQYSDSDCTTLSNDGCTTCGVVLTADTCDQVEIPSEDLIYAYEFTIGNSASTAVGTIGDCSTEEHYLNIDYYYDPEQKVGNGDCTNGTAFTCSEISYQTGVCSPNYYGVAIDSGSSTYFLPYLIGDSMHFQIYSDKDCTTKLECEFCQGTITDLSTCNAFVAIVEGSFRGSITTTAKYGTTGFKPCGTAAAEGGSAVTASAQMALVLGVIGMTWILFEF